jgi:hypothetical protein
MSGEEIQKRLNKEIIKIETSDEAWIDVQDELPDEDCSVLVATPEYVAIGVRLQGDWEVFLTPWDGPYDESDYEVTHWRPMPLLPTRNFDSD